MTIYAKSRPRQSLRDHLIEVRGAAEQLLTPARFAAFSRLGLSKSEARDLMLSAAWIHDFGKAEILWQDRFLSGQKLPQHSLTSFQACRWIWGEDSETMPTNQLVLSLAILAHHGQLHARSFLEEGDKYRRAEISPIGDCWRELSKEIPLAFPALKTLPNKISAAKVCASVGRAKMRVPSLARRSKFRGLYCLLLSLLVEADHLASGKQSPHPPFVLSPKFPNGKDWSDFQNQCREDPAQSLCALAGCGSGKTAMALERAAHYARERNIDRIVLCLPTRFTSNSLLRDMVNIYGYSDTDVGLVHSEALMVLREAMHDDDESSFPDSPEEQKGTPEGRAAKSVRYEHAVTISTVDHLLMSLYHGYKFADRAFGNLLSSLVVFDEVHAYDTTTLNAIREGQNVLNRYAIPTLFMSATLPSTRRQFFGFSGPQTIIEQNNPFFPFRAKPLKGPLTKGKGFRLEATDVARQALSQAWGLKLAIYVNQIERAKAMARAAKEELPDTPIFCYHSELAPQDRRDLEEKVLAAFKCDEPMVLVATQAAELSLNISAERMITELAPADTLVQRAGRLHRRGESPLTSEPSSRLPANFEFLLQIAPLDLTPHEKNPELIPGALPYDNVALLERTWENTPWHVDLGFDKGLQWCEDALIDPVPNLKGMVEEAHFNDTVFGRRPQENFNGEDNPDGVVIRDIDSEIVLVVPQCYYDAVLPDNRQALSQYQVAIRRSRFRSIPSTAIMKETIPLKIKKNDREEIEVAFPIIIIRDAVKYDPQMGGFDFSGLPQIAEDVTDDSNLIFNG